VAIPNLQRGSACRGLLLNDAFFSSENFPPPSLGWSRTAALARLCLPGIINVVFDFIVLMSSLRSVGFRTNDAFYHTENSVFSNLKFY